MSALRTHLNDPGVEMPGLTTIRGLMLAEAAAICLANQGHESGVVVSVCGHLEFSVQVGWDIISSRQLRTYADLQEATEHGAYGLAILLVSVLTGQVVVERSAKGPGFDYWIGDDSDDAPFQNLRRLEVSGILRGTDAQIIGRARTKLNQVIPSDGTAPALIVIVEFSRPLTRVEAK